MNTSHRWSNVVSRYIIACMLTIRNSILESCVCVLTHKVTIPMFSRRRLIVLSANAALLGGHVTC